MIFPGLKKLEKEFGFKDNGKFVYGFIESTYVMFADGENQKHVWFRFPVELNEEDKNKISSWKKKDYAKEISFGQSFDAEIRFAEYFIPSKVSKIKEVIEDVTSYIKEKYPEAKARCCGENCISDPGSELGVYDIEGFLVPLCPSCAKRLEDDIEKAYEEEKIKPNNYLQGVLGAFTFPIPGILLTILFFMLRRITAISGLVYYILARKGYLWAGGKFNKIGVLIISGASVFYAVAGTFVGYVALIVKEFYKEFSAEGVSIFNIIKYAVKTVLDNPVVRHNLVVNIRLSLVFCGLCIIIVMLQSLKQTEKTKVKKSS